MKQNYSVTHVILTGGVGSRLWPLSRKCQPKQYLDIFEGKSLFEMTVERNRNVAAKVMVVGNTNNCHLSKAILQKMDVDYIDIVESLPRNTAAAIAFAAFASSADEILMVTPSDHIIQNEEVYKEAVKLAIEMAEEGSIVTFGIKPTRAETGYGYIEFEGSEVIGFHEKPNVSNAIKFFQANNFYWNSGMFCFKASVFLAELQKFEPEVYKTTKQAWEANKNGYLDVELTSKIPSISVDYAVMERSEKITVVPSFFEWSDLGAFDSIYDYLIKNNHPVDENNNIVIGTGIHTSFVGVENCIFVHTPDAFLILQKENSQDVKKIYEYLEGIKSNLV